MTHAKWQHSEDSHTLQCESGRSYVIRQVGGLWRVSGDHSGSHLGYRGRSPLYESADLDKCKAFAKFADRHAQSCNSWREAPQNSTIKLGRGVTVELTKIASYPQAKIRAFFRGQVRGQAQLLHSNLETCFAADAMVADGDWMSFAHGNERYSHHMHDAFESASGLEVSPVSNMLQRAKRKAEGKDWPDEIERREDAFWNSVAADRELTVMQNPAVLARIEEVIKAQELILLEEEFLFKSEFAIALAMATGGEVGGIFAMEPDGDEFFPQAWAILPDGRAVSTRGELPADTEGKCLAAAKHNHLYPMRTGSFELSEAIAIELDGANYDYGDGIETMQLKLEGYARHIPQIAKRHLGLDLEAPSPDLIRLHLLAADALRQTKENQSYASL